MKRALVLTLAALFVGLCIPALFLLGCKTFVLFR